MNKIVILALFACVASALAAPVEIDDEASQLALFETDDKEIAGLGEEKQMFADFCLRTREDVKDQIKEGINVGTNRIFKLMVETLGQISETIGAAQVSAVEEGSKAINEDAREVKNAFVGIIAAMSESGKGKLFEIFESLKNKLTKEELQEVAEDSCVYVSNTLKPGLDRKLSAYKNELLKSPEAAQFSAVIKAAKVENLGCITTSRVSKVATACKMVTLLGATAWEMIG